MLGARRGALPSRSTRRDAARGEAPDRSRARSTAPPTSRCRRRSPRGSRASRKRASAAFGVCVAKTQYSFTADPTRLGAPDGHVLPVREVRLSAGAGFVVAICGEVMTMPGLPRRPAAEAIGLDAEGRIEGLS